MSGSARAALYALLAASLVLYARPQNVNGLVILAVMVTLSGLATFATRSRIETPALLPLTFVGFAALSSFWSTQGRVSAENALGLLAALYAATLLVRRVPIDDLIAWAAQIMWALVVVCALLAVTVPGIGRTVRDVNFGTWRGVLEHRNGLGYIVFLALVFYLAKHVQDSHHWKLRFWLTLGFYGFVLERAGSRSAMVLAGLVLVVWVALRSTRSSEQQRAAGLSGPQVATGLLGIAIAVLSAANGWTLIDAIGKRESLESRLDIWSGALQAVKPVIFQGFGWANILGDDDTAAQTISSFSGYFVRSTHNGYLAVLLQVGLLGLTIAMTLVVRAAWRSVRLVAHGLDQGSFWAFSTMLVLIAGDMTESRIFVNIGWFSLAMIWEYERLTLKGAAEAGQGPHRPKLPQQVTARSTR